jgi:outer membrane protein assembly factor BamB
MTRKRSSRRRPDAQPPSTGRLFRPRVKTRLPPVRTLVTIASLAAAIALVRAGWLGAVVGSVVDEAVENILSLILGFTALVSLLAWLVFESSHPGRLRLGVPAGLAAIVVVAAALLRIDGVNGDLVPRFAWRWSPPADRRLESLRPAAAVADAQPVTDGARVESGAEETWRETADDFPGFLGPDRDAAVDRPTLLGDWSVSQPRAVWSVPIGAGWGGFAVCDGHAVTLEQRGDQEIVSCRRVADGEVEWSVPVEARHETVLGGVGPRSTPTIRDGTVYSAGATGWLQAIDGRSGQVRWRVNVVEDLGIDPAAHAAAVSWGRAASPLVTDRHVIIPGGGPRGQTGQNNAPVTLVAYDRETGDRAWSVFGSQISYASPALATIDGRAQILSVNESDVTGHDPLDGRLLWSFPWVGHSNSDASCSQAHVVGEREVFVSKGYGIGAALFRLAAQGNAQVGEGRGPDGGDPRSATQVWHAPALLKTKFTNVVIHEGHAYGLSDGVLECGRLSDGRRAWKRGRYGQGQILRVGDHLLVQAEDGAVVLVACDPSAHRELGRFEAIRGQTWNTLCLAGRHLLCRNAEEAACWELPCESARPFPGAADGAVREPQGGRESSQDPVPGAGGA